MPSPLRMNLKSREGTDDNALMKIRDIENVKNLDVLFIGSSHAYRSFDPRIWKKRGYKSFNLGTSSQTHIHTGLLLNEYIDSLNPRVVVYEVYPDMFANRGVEANSIFLSYNICYDQMAQTVLQAKSLKSFNEYIFATYRRIKNSNEIIPIQVDTTFQRYVSHGFVERKNNDFHDIVPFTKGALLENQVSAFRENINFLMDNEIRIVLVRAPVTSVEVNRFPDLEGFNDIMDDYDYYFDYSNMIELEDSFHFYDYHHLNQKGVELFNPIFIDTLEQLGILNNY